KRLRRCDRRGQRHGDDHRHREQFRQKRDDDRHRGRRCEHREWGNKSTMSKTTETARLLALLSACSLLTGSLSGCGGGSGSLPSGTGTTGSGMGRAVFTVVWPQRTRLIPLASNSIKVTVTQGTNTLASKIIPRPAQGGEASAEFDALPVGTLTATAIAYPQTN